MNHIVTQCTNNKKELHNNNTANNNLNHLVPHYYKFKKESKTKQKQK